MVPVHGDRMVSKIMLETPKDPIDVEVIEYFFSGGRVLAKHTHPALTLEEDLQQQLSSPLLLLRHNQALFLFFLLFKLFQLPPLRLSKAEGPSRATILRLRPPGTSLLSPVLFWISRFLIKPQK